jgi:hypothetical protein
VGCENDKNLRVYTAQTKKTNQSLHLLLLIFAKEMNAVPSTPIIFES